MKGRVAQIFLALVLLLPAYSAAENLDLKEIQAKILEYKGWLEQRGTNGSRYWVSLDSSKRPHRLFVGPGFMQANAVDKERFIEIFSRFLAGHPEKNMLIDIYEPGSGKWIGEYGFGGFRLF
jgi:hypothetical protein